MGQRKIGYGQITRCILNSRSLLNLYSDVILLLHKFGIVLSKISSQAALPLEFGNSVHLPDLCFNRLSVKKGRL